MYKVVGVQGRGGVQGGEAYRVMVLWWWWCTGCWVVRCLYTYHMIYCVLYTRREEGMHARWVYRVVVMVYMVVVVGVQGGGHVQGGGVQVGGGVYVQGGDGVLVHRVVVYRWRCTGWWCTGWWWMYRVVVYRVAVG